MSHLSREAILTVLSGLTVLGCDKAATVKAEPAASAPLVASAAPAAVPAAPAAPTAAASAPTTAAAAPSGAGIAAKEVPSAQGHGAEKEKTCSPGGCAPGQCGGSKK